MLRRLTLLVIFCCTFAQASGSYKFRYYTDRDGLSSNTIQCLFQDTKGYIWIGTLDGLDRFNSHDFRNFRYDNRLPYTIENNSIYSICAESNSGSERMWVGTGKGVYVFNSADENFFPLPLETDGTDRSNVIVYSLAHDTAGNVWIGTLGEGLFRYNVKTGILERYGTEKYPGVFSSDVINKVMLDRSNNVWVGVGTSLLRYNPENNGFSRFEVNDRASGNAISRVSTMCQDSFGDIWIAGFSNELYRFEISDITFTFYQPPAGMEFGRVRALVEYTTGTLMLGSENGLVNFDVKNRAFSYADDGTSSSPGALNDKFIHTILKGRDGGLWIGTYFGGINYLSPLSPFFTALEPPAECGRVISRLCEDSEGDIWIGSDDGGLSRFRPRTGTWEKIIFDMENPSPNIHSLVIDGPNLWIGTYGSGLYCMELATHRAVRYTHDMENTDNLDVYSMLRDSRGNFWIGTKRSICLFEEATATIRRVVDMGVSCDVVDIREDLNGDVWFASLGKGLMRYDRQTHEITVFTTDTGPGFSDFISCLLVENNSLWIGTHGNGICRYDLSEKNFNRDFQDTQYANCTVFQMMITGSEIWLTTNKGLLRYNFRNGSRNISRFTADDGLLANIFNPNSGIKTSTGHIYIGCNNGINSFYPYDFTRHDNSTRLTVVFPGIKFYNPSGLSGEVSVPQGSFDNRPTLNLVGGRQNVTIEFVAINYAAPARTMYRYRLENFDEEWTVYDGGGIQHVSYNNLPPGKFRFMVSAANGSEPYGESSSIYINIRPRFIASRIMVFLYVLSGLGLLAFLTKYIIGRMKRRHREQIEWITRKNKMELLEARIDLFTEVANEIRTPVSLIAAPLEEIARNRDIPKDIGDDINIIRKNCDRLMRLVDQIVNLRPVETTQSVVPDPGVDIREELEKAVAVALAVPANKRNIEFCLELPPYDIVADICLEYFRQLLHNLLSSAYLHAESRINVTLARGAGKDDGLFIIEVKDDGTGLGRETRSKVIDKFHTAKMPGFGLQGVRILAIRMSGHVEVESIIGQWTQVVLKLPFFQRHVLPDKLTEQGDAKSGNEKDTKLPVLLLLENNPDFMEFFVRHLSVHYFVVAAQTEEKAMDIIRSRRVSAVVAAWDRPHLDGVGFTAGIRKDGTLDHIPVIVTSADVSPELKVRALKAGADVFLEKPVPISVLESQIESLISNRRQLRSKFSKTPYFVTEQSDEPAGLENSFIGQVNQYIIDHISNSNMTVDDLAMALGMGRSAFFTRIRSITGITPAEYLRNTRLKTAAELLAAPNNLRVTEICYMVGFSSTSYFSKCFQGEYGMTPSEFMERYRKE